MQKFFLNSLIAVPVVAVILFVNSAFLNGNSGLKLDKTQSGFLVSGVSEEVTPLRPGDVIVSLHGLSYTEFLGVALSRTPAKQPGKIVVRRGAGTTSFDLETVPYTTVSLLSRIWPRLLLILTFLAIGSIALHRASPGPQVRLFFLMLCSFSMALAVTIPSAIGLLSPQVYSLSFMIHAVSNWTAFGLWAHFALRFPASRDLVGRRWWIPLCIYLLPAATAIGGALYAAGTAPEFWGWVQRLRNLYLPVIILGVFFKHVLDYRKIAAGQEKNQVKLTIVTYWLTFAPYLFLYLLPNLLFDRPLVSFRIAVFAFFVLPVAYLAGILQYRFFNIDRFISRALAYFTITIGLLILYSLFLVGLRNWFLGEQVLSKELFLVFLIFVNILFHPLIVRLDLVIKRLFFRHQAISAKTMHRLSTRVSASLHLSDLVRLVTRELPRDLHIDAAAILPLETNAIRLLPEYRLPMSVPWRESRLATLFRADALQYVSALQPVADATLAAELARIHGEGFSLVLPLRSSRPLSALLLVGPKKNGRSFHEEEMHLLASFANQAAVALENAVHYESLVESKNQLEEMFEQTVQAEKMATIGKMTSMLAHELKNPLGIIHSSAQYLLEGKQSGAVAREMLQYIKGEAEHLDLSISSILKLARQKPPEFKQVDLASELRRLMGRWQRSGDHRSGIQIDVRIFEPLPPVYADFRQLSQVLLNLVRNSEEMMTNGGPITLEARQIPGGVEIRLMDRGPGIPEENLDRVFQHFFTTREKGLGLGLAVCRQIVSAHNGEITLANRDGGGAVACIRLPGRPLATMEASRLQEAILSL